MRLWLAPVDASWAKAVSVAVFGQAEVHAYVRLAFGHGGDAFDDEAPDIGRALDPRALAPVEIDLYAWLPILDGRDHEALSRHRPVLKDRVELAVGELEADFVRIHGAFLGAVSTGKYFQCR